MADYLLGSNPQLPVYRPESSLSIIYYVCIHAYFEQQPARTFVEHNRYLSRENRTELTVQPRVYKIIIGCISWYNIFRWLLTNVRRKGSGYYAWIFQSIHHNHNNSTRFTRPFLLTLRRVNYLTRNPFPSDKNCPHWFPPIKKKNYRRDSIGMLSKVISIGGAIVKIAGAVTFHRYF